ncbi:MAG: phosphoenolpyruvate carboxykinase (ATP), partial [Chitinophagales bacterium]
MQVFGVKNPSVDLEAKGLGKVSTYWNLSPAALIEKTIRLNQGKLAKSGALTVDTGQFTGRSPKDRFIVKDDITAASVDWGDVNQAISPEQFDGLYEKVINHLNNCGEIYVKDAYACANLDYRLNIRVYTEHPWQSLFVHNMFLRPSQKAKRTVEPDWEVFAAPGCLANPAIDGTRQENFAIINFTKKQVIIGGTAYTGEIKKSIFSALNFLLPTERGVL